MQSGLKGELERPSCCCAGRGKPVLTEIIGESYKGLPVNVVTGAWRLFSETSPFQLRGADLQMDQSLR